MDTALQLDIVHALIAAEGKSTVPPLFADFGVGGSPRGMRDILNALQPLEDHGVIRRVQNDIHLTEAGAAMAGDHAERRLPLEVAEPIARQLVRDLQEIPGVISLQIAGSIRRRKESIGDIELVALVDAAQADLFGKPSASPVMALTCALRARADKVIAAGGAMTRVIISEPEVGRVKVDLFQTCRPECWGMLYVIRTGSADWVRRMLAYWKRCTGGGECKNLRLRLADGTEVDTPEEEDVFGVISRHSTAAGLRPVPFVPPERRTPRE